MMIELFTGEVLSPLPPPATGSISQPYTEWVILFIGFEIIELQFIWLGDTGFRLELPRLYRNFAAKPPQCRRDADCTLFRHFKIISYFISLCFINNGDDAASLAYFLLWVIWLFRFSPYSFPEWWLLFDDGLIFFFWFSILPFDD